MDVSMLGQGGVDAIRSILARSGDVRVIGLSMHAEADSAENVRGSGAADYIAKSGPQEDLVTAIRCAAAGRQSSCG